MNWSRNLCKLLIYISFALVMCLQGESLVVKESLFPSYVTDYIGNSDSFDVLVYRTGITIRSNVISDKVIQKTNIYLDGDIIETIEKGSSIFAIGRMGYIYALSMDKGQLTLIDTLSLDSELLDMDIDDDRMAVMSDSLVFTAGLEGFADLDTVIFPVKLSSIVLSGNRIFAAHGMDSIYISVGDSISTFFVGNPVERLEVAGDYLMAVSLEHPSRLYDITGERPVLISSFGDEGEFFTDFELDGEYLYASVMNRGLTGWFIGELPKMERIISAESWKISRTLTIKDSLAYISNGPSGLSIFNIYEENPVEYRPFADVLTMDIELTEQAPLVALGKAGIAVLKDGENTLIPTEGFARDISTAGRHILACVEGVGLLAMKQDTSGIPKLLHTIPTERTFAAGGNDRFFAYHDMADGKLHFMRRMGDDFLGAKEIGVFEHRFVREMAFDRDFCAAALDMGGFALYGLGEGISPLSQINTGGNVRGIYLEGDRLYVADGRTGISMWDVGDPSSPSEIWSHALPGASDIVVNPQYIAASRDDGLTLMKNNGQKKPEILAEHHNAGLGTRVAMTGNRIYMADQYSLFVFDISE